MELQNKPRTGGRILVDQLHLHGVDMAFGVPGESYLAILDALHDTPELRYVICRQEGGAAMMADAYGKLMISWSVIVPPSRPPRQRRS